MRHPEHHIFQFSPESLRAWCAERAMPGYRADQILDWVYRKNTADPAQMSNLGKRDRELLAQGVTFLSGEVVAHRRASDGTQKLLVEWTDAGAPHVDPDGAARREVALPIAGDASAPAAGASDRQTECVMIPVEAGEESDESDGQPRRTTSARRTACISSQVGCPVGCRFCASGLGGLDGNLTAGRIVEQVWRLQQLPGVGRISNVVFMGMGEPLSNFSAVKHAVQTLAAPWGMGISARKITISTVGLPQAIEKLSEQLDLPVTLALSLHAPTDELRRTLIPWSNYTTIAELIAACDAWFRKTGREITLEYILLGGVNDQAEHARELAKVARRLRSNVNLIRYNEVRGLPFARPKTEDVRKFQAILRESNVNAHIRASRGRDIEAACGQLRHEAAASA